MNQNGAMHRFDAFPENRLLKRWAKNITRILHFGPACVQRRYNSFERIDLNKSGFIPVIFIAVNNAGWDFRSVRHDGGKVASAQPARPGDCGRGVTQVE
jgi:hypothetical protein